MVVWQFFEIWTITAFSRLKYTFVTFTSLPLALRRRMPGRISRISILLGGWNLLLGARAKSVHPEMHVCAEGVCSNIVLACMAVASCCKSPILDSAFDPTSLGDRCGRRWRRSGLCPFPPPLGG